MWRAAGAICSAAALLASCASTPPSPGSTWTRIVLQADGRLLAAAMPAGQAPGPLLTIFIEGDGAAHDRTGRPVRDPTPRDATSLEIARAWPTGPKAWLGRPCQYVGQTDPNCRPADWTVDRFSPRAVSATDKAIDQLKARAGAENLRLVGWSGGGVLAVALAARRTDVAELVTLAAPLDLAAWAEFHGASALPPVAALDATRLATRQLHLFGARDRVTPPGVGLRAARRLAGPDGGVEVWSESHVCCWAARAPEIADRLAALPPRPDPAAPPPEPPRPGSKH